MRVRADRGGCAGDHGEQVSTVGLADHRRRVGLGVEAPGVDQLADTAPNWLAVDAFVAGLPMRESLCRSSDRPKPGPAVAADSASTGVPGPSLTIAHSVSRSACARSAWSTASSP